MESAMRRWPIDQVEFHFRYHIYTRNERVMSEKFYNLKNRLMDEHRLKK
jgi:hypothetical protein